MNENQTSSVLLLTSNESDSELKTLSHLSAEDDSKPSHHSYNHTCSRSSNLHPMVNINMKMKSHEALFAAESSYAKEEISRDGKEILTSKFDKVHAETAAEESREDDYTSIELPYGEPILHQPLNLSASELELITNSFKLPLEHTAHCTVYSGQMKVSDCQSSAVVVHKFQGHRNKILKAEKKVSLTMYHKNILRLAGYHQSENATFIVYPYVRHTLDRFLFGKFHNYF